MNPDRNTGGMTLNAMLQVGLVASAIIPAIVVALLGFMLPSDLPTTVMQQRCYSSSQHV